MFLCEDWERSPLDIAVVNQLLCSHIQSLDPTHTAFTVYCATKMPQQRKEKLQKHARSTGVRLIDYAQIDKLDNVSIIVGHFPQTHNEMIKYEMTFANSVTKIAFIHSPSPNEELKEFAKEFTSSDLVLCIGEEAKQICKRYFRRPEVNSYIPPCPSELIPALGDTHSYGTDFETGSYNILTYCNGMYKSPVVDFGLAKMKQCIFANERVAWKIVTSNEYAKSNVAESFGEDPRVTCVEREHVDDLFQDICDAQFCAPAIYPEVGVLHVDLIWAICSAKPILHMVESQATTNVLQELLGVSSLDGNLGFADFKTPITLSDSLQEGAKKRHIQYLKNTDVLHTHMEVLRFLAGTKYNTVVMIVTGV